MDLYKNFLKGNTVFVATDRMGRPNDFKKEKNTRTIKENCAFCNNNIDSLTDILYQNENVLILKNKYPAVLMEHSSHEVIIDSREHLLSFHETDIQKMVDVLYGIIAREKEIFKDEKVKSFHVFKNEGVGAGTSIEHSHAQIVALPIVSDKTNQINSKFNEYYEKNKACYFCTLKENDDIFTFYENDSFKAFCKNDDVLSNTVTILPKRHINKFSDLTDDEITDFAKIIKIVTYAIGEVIDNFSFNMVYYVSPKIDGKFNDNFHFFLEIIPRHGNFGGFEFSTGAFVNSAISSDFSKKLKDTINKHK